MQSEGAVAYKTFKIVTRIKTLYRSYIAILYRVCNHVKLEICLFVMNFNSGGVFSKSSVLCGGCWLWAWQISGYQFSDDPQTTLSTNFHRHNHWPLPQTITTITLQIQIQARIGNEENPSSDHSDIPQSGSHCNQRGRIQAGETVTPATNNLANLSTSSNHPTSMCPSMAQRQV